MEYQGTIIEAELERELRTSAAAVKPSAGPEFDAPRPLSPAAWKRLPSGLKRVNQWLRSQGRPNQCPVEGGAA